MSTPVIRQPLPIAQAIVPFELLEDLPPDGDAMAAWLRKNAGAWVLGEERLLTGFGDTTFKVGDRVYAYYNLQAQEWHILISGAGSGAEVFPAFIFDKVSAIIDEASSDVLFNQGCPPSYPPRRRGRYSWWEAEYFADGVYIPMHGGRFGVAGDCDEALEDNRSNANIHLETMVVWMREGDAVECSDIASASESGSRVKGGSSFSGRSTNRRYHFNLNLPREDCAIRFTVAAAPDNDTP